MDKTTDVYSYSVVNILLSYDNKTKLMATKYLIVARVSKIIGAPQ
ncbi:7779_t:CDS:1, partial [Gigaspora margarita]